MDYIKIIDDVLENSGKKYDSAAIVNRDGVIEYTKRINNKFDMFSYDKGRIGKKFFDAFADLDMSNSSVLRAIRTGKVARNEKQILMCGNIKVIVEGDTYPIFDENGEIQGAVDAVRYLEYYNYNKRQSKEDEKALSRIVTVNQDLRIIKDKLPEIAENDSDIFLYGETGTGKEVFARVIHTLSGRRDKPFMIQNCAAIPPNLMESIFFGTEPGGFTGAESKPGLFELADGGTLLLDEINSMDIQMQAKLLTALENGAVRRIGGRKEIPFDTRIICASNEYPELLFKGGRFRADLYYRISPIKLHIPPLRERTEDILPLTEHFIKVYNKKFGRDIKGLTDMTTKAFLNWSWPGNVRELRNVIESAFNFEITDKITLGSVKELLEEIHSRANTAVSGRKKTSGGGTCLMGPAAQENVRSLKAFAKC